MVSQPISVEQLARLYDARNRANSELSKAHNTKPRDPDLVVRMRQRARALNGAYNSALKQFKRQQKAASRAELRNTMIRFYLDAQESHI